MLNNKISDIKFANKIENAESFEIQELIEEQNRLVNQNHKYQKLEHTDLTLIDLGNCEQFRTSEGHRPNIYSQETTSRNCFWASKHYFSKNVLSRRDDIIQIVYNLLYLTQPVKFEMSKVFLDADDQYLAMKKYKLEKTPT